MCFFLVFFLFSSAAELIDVGYERSSKNARKVSRSRLVVLRAAQPLMACKKPVRRRWPRCGSTVTRVTNRDKRATLRDALVAPSCPRRPYPSKCSGNPTPDVRSSATAIEASIVSVVVCTEEGLYRPCHQQQRRSVDSRRRLHASWNGNGPGNSTNDGEREGLFYAPLLPERFTSTRTQS